MALAQAQQVRELILDNLPDVWVDVDIVGMQTRADLWQGDLTAIGGKGNFTKEIDDALVGGRVDIAVHCMKDVPGDVPLTEGTGFAAFLPRDDVHDVLVSSDNRGFSQLPAGARIGTSSVRRRVQLLMARSDLNVQPIRSNVDSRLAKLDSGDYDALVLGRAGMLRLGLPGRISEIFPITANGSTPAMVPAIGAGTLGVQARLDDDEVFSLFSRINDVTTARCIAAERAMLTALGGHCNSPIAGYAEMLPDGSISMIGLVFNEDGTKFAHAKAGGPAQEPEKIGAAIASDLISQGAQEMIESTRR
jgi:hydroxymethylbilane synthase